MKHQYVPMSTFGLRHAMFGILTLLPVLGCSGAPLETAEEASPTAEQTTTVESALTIGPLKTYKASRWTNGISTTKMISKNAGYCYLTEMGGWFTSDHDWLRVEVGGDGNWYFYAASDGVPASDGNVGTFGTAACIGWNTLNGGTGGTVGKMFDSGWFSSDISGTAPQPNAECNLSGIGGDWRADQETGHFGNGEGSTIYDGSTLGPPAGAAGTCTSRTRAVSSAPLSRIQEPPCYGTEPQPCGDLPGGMIADKTYVCTIINVRRMFTTFPALYAEIYQDSSGAWHAQANSQTALTFNCFKP